MTGSGSRDWRSRPFTMGVTALRVSRPLALVFLLASVATGSHAQEPESFTPEEIGAGAKIYARHCAPCHGPRMVGGDIDIRKFPRDQRSRFTSTVANGKGSMPPWRDLLSPDDITNLWAYVVLGERP